MKKTYFLSGILCLLAFALPAVVLAQPNPPTGPPCWPPPCVPIDGGLSFLILAGAAYGGKKIYDSKKKPESTKAE
jgi:hypothetical protein